MTIVKTRKVNISPPPCQEAVWERLHMRDKPHVDSGDFKKLCFSFGNELGLGMEG